MEATMAPKVKPLLRGVSHEWGFYTALLAGLWLVLAARPGTAAWAGAIYAASLATLLGVSALYHRPMWSKRARARMRRLDHSAIYLLIAGTGTALLLMSLPPATARLPLAIIWTGAGLGIAKSIVWSHAPRWVTTAIYLSLGWVLVPFFPAMRAALTAADLVLFVVGGLAYSAGAVVYALRRPNPSPTVFGYHEVFHVLVLVASVCHYLVVRSLVTG